MKKIIITIIVVLLIMSALVYFDYFNVKTNNTSPKISLKEKISDSQTLYKAFFYRVWYCDTNKTYTIGSYSDADAICPINYSYVEGYYTNSEGIKISKRDLQLLTNDGIYTSEMVEAMNSNKQVEDAVHVAYNYGRYKYKLTSKKSSDGYKLIVLPEFKEEENNYKWVYDEENLYCLKDSDKTSIAKYEDSCGKFEVIKMDKDWCDSYTSSTLVYEENINKYCEE